MSRKSQKDAADERRSGADAQAAIQLLQELTHPASDYGSSKLPKGTTPMSPAEVSMCSGLAFCTTTKIGVGVAGVRGHGFVMAKLPSSASCPWIKHGPGWSAPLFFRISGASFGATLGYSTVQSVIVFDKPASLTSFYERRQQGTLDADVNFAFGSKYNRHLAEGGPNQTWGNVADSMEYSVSQGLLLDFSLKGGAFTQDSALNAEVYGKDTHPQDVLTGHAEPPQDFVPLYAELNGLMGAGQPVGGSHI